LINAYGIILAMTSLRQLVGGYTITEVMIVLSISMGIFASSALAINRQNANTEFQQAIGTFEQEIQDALNDVSTGYYAKSGDFSCAIDVATQTPRVTDAGPGNVQQGQNTPCIFVGRAFSFNNDSSQFSLYTLIGRRINALNQEAKSLDDANPTALGINSNSGIVQQSRITSLIEVKKVIQRSNGAIIGGLGIISDFGQTNTLDHRVSGNASRVSLASIPSGAISGAITGLDNTSIDSARQGILICLREPNNGKKASITIEGDNLSVVKTVDFWPDAECGP
jgi:hypothetical protein